MQGAFHQKQLFVNPLQLPAARLHSIETRFRTEEAKDLIFTDEAEARLLLSSLQPAAHAQQLLQILKASQKPEPKANVGGNLTLGVIKTPEGLQCFRVSIDEGKRKHVLDRVEQVRQSAHWALRDNFKTPSHERGGR
jgi:hypothetical protein